MTDTPAAARTVIETLNTLEIPYMVTGSLVTNYYSIPRATKDADFVVELGDRSVSEISAALGDTFELEEQMSFETVTGSHKYVFKHRPTSFVIELFLLRDDPHSIERFERRIKVDMNGLDTWISTAEDSVITKLNWISRAGRQKDIDDVPRVMAMHYDDLDWAYIERWCTAHGSVAAMQSAKNAASRIKPQ